MTPEHLEWVQSYLTEMFRQIGMNKFLGMQVVEVTEGKVVLSMKVAEKHTNIYGSIHGGALASVADVVMGSPCITMGKRIVTIDMNISYIKGAPKGSTITAVGELIGNGNSIMRSVGRIYDGEELLVSSQASYFIIGDFTKEDSPQPMLTEK